MDNLLSRTEKKRRAKDVEKLAAELVALPSSNVGGLPCDPVMRREISVAQGLKGGARKRQVKFIAKTLRQQPIEPLLLFLEKQKGSHLKRTRDFHELERFRDALLTEAIKDSKDEDFPGKNRPGEGMAAILRERFPDLDIEAVLVAAGRYAECRKPLYGREIFRLLKAAQERMNFKSAAKVNG